MKKLLTRALAALCLLALCGCSSEGLRERRLPLKLDDAETVSVTDAATGETVRLTESESVRVVTEAITTQKYVQTSKLETGNERLWTDQYVVYRVEWLNADGNVTDALDITHESGYQIRYHDTMRKVADGKNIDMSVFAGLFEEESP